MDIDPLEVTTLDNHSRLYVTYVLGLFKGNVAKAARALDIHRRTLYRMIERWDICKGQNTSPSATPVSSAAVPQSNTASDQSESSITT